MPDFNSNKWDDTAWAANESVAARIRNVMNRAVREAVAIVAGLSSVKSDRPFSFDDYPHLRKKINAVFQQLAKGIQVNLNDGSIKAWALANAKNDALIEWAAKNTGIHQSLLRRYKYGARNDVAREAFQSRVENGMGLSDRVWRIANQARQEIEMSIDLGLSSGSSAAALSRSVRKYLNEPEKLFRRVRDKHGKLQLSKNAEAYHPGRGVYRSSYKNAMRLTRTENNMAYREADYLRWNALDFVVGVEVRLSNNPNVCPVCQSLKGKYPKGFKFVGWHPQCRCYVIPILITKSEFNELELQLLNEEDTSGFESTRTVSDVPAGFRNWVRDNKDRVGNWANMPYWVQDNFKGGNIGNGLLLSVTKGVSALPMFDALKANGFAVFGTMEDYDSVIKGFDLAEFDRNFSNLMAQVGVDITHKRLNIYRNRVEFTYQSPDSKAGTLLVRSFYKNSEKKLEAHHDWFALPESVQGGGTSKKVFNLLYKQYKAAKVKKLTVQANLDIGGYTWGRYGFNGNDLSSVRDIISLARVKLNPLEMERFAKWLEDAKRDNFFPVFNLAKTEFGKKLLVGSNWHGYVDLTNAMQRKVFEDYLFSSK